MIEFTLPPEILELKARTELFVREQCIPLENDARQEPHGPREELRLELNARAREAGLLAPHASREWGGLGLDHRGKAVVFEAAGYSTLGPLALHIQAPDEGNVHLLEQVASREQKERWLPKLAGGSIRSMFCMTEPEGGAGSDPSMLKTVARPDGDGFRIFGRKWLITGAVGAQVMLVMARTEDVKGNDLGASLFVVGAEAPGWKIVRVLDTVDSNSAGGHSVLEFDGLRVGREHLVGEVGKGFRYAQVRLGPARLTHCMRWLGAARRAHDVAVDYARTRRAFGKSLGEHEGVGFQLADNEMELHLCRLAIWHAAWLLDSGAQARTETSMCKVVCSEALNRVVDRAVQILGGRGITRDTVVERIWRDIRPFRIYDGPSEVHRWSIAREILRKDRE
jgi:acyl-CoA dehydrogenase